MEDLLSIPLTRFELAAEAARLDKALAAHTVEVEIATRLAAYRDLEAEPDPVRRRYRAAMLRVFSEEELEQGLRNQILALLPFSRRAMGGQ